MNVNELKESAQKVQIELARRGFANVVIELPGSTRTAQEAADQIGCSVAQIAKSIIFRINETDEPLLIVTSGTNRVNEKHVSKMLNVKLSKADADFIREKIGYVIGGVPPIGHLAPVKTLIDEDLRQYAAIWAAGGHPFAVFELTFEQLVDMTGGQVTAVDPK
ncbi:YbaK/EbsC family protein [Paenibacillus sp. GXUN7292]|uniref:YbaK/EbsC family protein n=2 Tax=unclassified Paenibacillus TaxID=185978 RepID=UPI003D7EA59D